MRSIDPATGKIIKIYEELKNKAIKEKLERSSLAFLKWRKTSFKDRSEILKITAQNLRNSAPQLAELMTSEMGKLHRSGIAEINKCAWVCEFYAEKAENFLQNRIIETDARKSYVTYDPLGPVLAVMPWNFPFWQVFRFAAPALMAGNTALLKHASNVCGCALAIEDIFLQSGLPEGIFQTLLIGSDKVAAVIRNQNVKAVSLTGSTPAGKAVAAVAGSVLKKTVLELGGNDAYIILADADLEVAVKSCFTSRMINAGQSCIAAKRFIVHSSVIKEFTAQLSDLMQQVKLGDPRDPSTDLGPLARTDLRDELHGQVQDSIKQGAECICGGFIPDGQGAFYPPTMLTKVKPGMAAFEEELFGPVAVIIEARTESEAIELANHSNFGLGAAIFSSNLEKAELIAAQDLQAGCVFINDFVRSDPRLPFGGIKTSGYGRELSEEGITEFVNIKTVYLK